MRMKTITIVNMKGGSTKTTTSRNMGYILATTYQHRVLLVDIDPSGNLSASFNLRPEPDDFGCVSTLLMEKNSNPLDFIKHTRVNGLDILPGNKTISPAEIKIKMDQMNPQQFRLKKQLEKVQNDYDYCIIDCPPSENLMVINALAACDEVIVPTTASKDSLDGISYITSIIDNVSEYNSKIRLRGVLFSRIARNSVCSQVLATQFNFPRFKTFIRESVAAEYSLLEGKAFREDDKRSNPAIDYDNFVAEYLGVPYPHP